MKRTLVDDFTTGQLVDRFTDGDWSTGRVIGKSTRLHVAFDGACGHNAFEASLIRSGHVRQHPDGAPMYGEGCQPEGELALIRPALTPRERELLDRGARCTVTAAAPTLHLAADLLAELPARGLLLAIALAAGEGDDSVPRSVALDRGAAARIALCRHLRTGLLRAWADEHTTMQAVEALRAAANERGGAGQASIQPLETP